MAETRQVTGDCGFQTRCTLDEIVPQVQVHGRDVHNMDVTADQVLAMSAVVG
ncbi:MAG: DUF1059 domain-containing protein [Candidatus Nanopelagicales bacterium]